ncbi:Uncharacterised protein [uncultured archaeon]|nr:Uncharacterised protein [uncultured archaeon]
MAELKIYTTYQEFHDRVYSGKNKDYVLTSRMPLGISVCIGEEPFPERKGPRRFLPYHEERTVVCVGEMDNCRHLFAVKKSWLEMGGKLGGL